MKIQILSAEENLTFRGGKEFISVTTVKYRTEKGYEGSVEIDTKNATKENILEAIRKSSEGVESLLGATIST